MLARRVILISDTYVFYGEFLCNVIAWEGVKFGINFTSCSENGNKIARGIAECYFAIIASDAYRGGGTLGFPPLEQSFPP